jgi:hypothetical protein
MGTEAWSNLKPGLSPLVASRMAFVPKERATKPIRSFLMKEDEAASHALAMLLLFLSR